MELYYLGIINQIKFFVNIIFFGHHSLIRNNTQTAVINMTINHFLHFHLEPQFIYELLENTNYIFFLGVSMFRHVSSEVTSLCSIVYLAELNK